jgi:nucleoside diphosphate kinase
MQLTAAAVTPPAEHAARRPAGAADAAAADAGVVYTDISLDKYARMVHTNMHENNTEY